MDGDCTNKTTPTLFINFVPTLLDVEWTASFRGPGSPPPPPAYVQDFAVGVARSYVTAELRRASSESPTGSQQEHRMQTCGRCFVVM